MGRTSRDVGVGGVMGVDVEVGGVVGVKSGCDSGVTGVDVEIGGVMGVEGGCNSFASPWISRLRRVLRS